MFFNNNIGNGSGNMIHINFCSKACRENTARHERCLMGEITKRDKLLLVLFKMVCKEKLTDEQLNAILKCLGLMILIVLN